MFKFLLFGKEGLQPVRSSILLFLQGHVAWEEFIINGRNDKYWLCSYYHILLLSPSSSHCYCYVYGVGNFLLWLSLLRSQIHPMGCCLVFPAELLTMWEAAVSEVAFVAASGLAEVTFFTTGKVRLYMLQVRYQAAFMEGNLLASFSHAKHNHCLLIVCLSDSVKYEVWLCYS